MKIVGVQVSNELEHAYVHAHTVTVDVLATIAAEKREGTGAPCSWWARKQLAAFNTTTETVVDCKFAVAVSRYSH